MAAPAASADRVKAVMAIERFMGGSGGWMGERTVRHARRLFVSKPSRVTAPRTIREDFFEPL
jgi:hypothetical protein